MYCSELSSAVNGDMMAMLMEVLMVALMIVVQLLLVLMLMVVSFVTTVSIVFLLVKYFCGLFREFFLESCWEYVVKSFWKCIVDYLIAPRIPPALLDDMCFAYYSVCEWDRPTMRSHMEVICAGCLLGVGGDTC